MPKWRPNISEFGWEGPMGSWNSSRLQESPLPHQPQVSSWARVSVSLKQPSVEAALGCSSTSQRDCWYFTACEFEEDRRRRNPSHIGSAIISCSCLPKITSLAVHGYAERLWPAVVLRARSQDCRGDLQRESSWCRCSYYHYFLHSLVCSDGMIACITFFLFVCSSSVRISFFLLLRKRRKEKISLWEHISLKFNLKFFNGRGLNTWCA